MWESNGPAREQMGFGDEHEEGDEQAQGHDMVENCLLPQLGQGTWIFYCMISIIEPVLVEPYPNKRELMLTSQTG